MVTDLTPLRGITVVDFTHILAGPYSTQLLADAGALVVKVEPPGGEYSRIRGSSRVAADGTAVSSYSASVNRGKKSIVLDLRTSAGLNLAHRLIDQADVVVENYAPGALARLGLEMAELRRQRPSLITASVSLFGASEDRADLATRGGLAIVAEAESGLMNKIRDANKRPMALGFPLGDMAVGLATYAAIVTSLYARRESGLGSHHDVSMVGTLLAFNSVAVLQEQISPASSEVVARPAGMGVFRCLDGFVVIGVNSDALFRRLVGVMGQPNLADDPRYEHYEERDRRVDEVDRLIEEWTMTRRSSEVVDLLSRSKVPSGRVADASSIMTSSDLHDLNALVEIDDGIGGTFRVPRNALGFQPSGSGIPQLAQDRDNVLQELLGLESAEIARLRLEGAFGQVDEAP